MKKVFEIIGRIIIFILFVAVTLFMWAISPGGPR